MDFFKKTASQKAPPPSDRFTDKIHINATMLEEAFSKPMDLQTKFFSTESKQYCLVFLKTIIKKDLLDARIISPLIQDENLDVMNLPLPDIQKQPSKKQVIEGISDAKIALFQEGDSNCYLIEASDFLQRAVTEPTTEQVIYGSHEGFIEGLEGNINLLRKRLKTEHFQIKSMTIGDNPSTKLAYCYIDNKVDNKILKIVEERLQSIEIHIPLTVGTLQNYLDDNIYSPFPQLMITEKPSRAAEYISEGAIALIVDGSSSVFLMPVTFFAFYHAPDDRLNRIYVGTFKQLLRLLGIMVSLSLPAFYIALVSFYYEIIPIDLVADVKGSLENIPFPPLIEAFLMQIILELLREAAVRLPNSIAQTIGVVGGLVIGTAIVEANLVSNTMLIVIAITAISSFVIPNQEMGITIRLLSFPLMVLAYMFGLLGIFLGLMIILFHLCKLDSLGRPYFEPIAPFSLKNTIRTFINLPVKKEN